MAGPYCEVPEVKEVLGIAQDVSVSDEKIGRCIDSVSETIDDQLTASDVSVPSTGIPALLNRACKYLAAYDFRNPSAESVDEAKLNERRYQLPGQKALEAYIAQNAPTSSVGKVRSTSYVEIDEDE